MVQYKDEDFAPLVAKFKEPTRRTKKGQIVKPYVLFGHYLRERRLNPETGSKEYHLVPDLFMLDMSGAHAQETQLQYYAIQKRFKVIKWHLPADFVTEDGHTPYALLDQQCEMYAMVGGASQMAERLKEAEAKASALEKEVEAAKTRMQDKKVKAE